MVGDEFEQVHAGRRLEFLYPVGRDKEMAVVVLDSPRGKGEDESRCAAILVPAGREQEWMYTTEGGQWQLLASAGVERLIVLLRNWEAELERSAGLRARKVAYRGLVEVVGDNGNGKPRDFECVLTEGFSRPDTMKVKRSRECAAAEAFPRISRNKGSSRGLDRYGIGGGVHTGHGSKLESARCLGRNRDVLLVSKTDDVVERDEEAVCIGEIGSLKGRKDHRRRQKMELARLDNYTGGTNDTNTLPAARASEYFGMREYLAEELKEVLSPLIIALAPKLVFERGPPIIPFVTYTDNVLRRVVLEEVCSPLTGLMVVEDVEISELADDTNECTTVSSEDGGVLRMWRRRLRFKRMPNLIQTEVPLIMQMNGVRNIRSKSECKEQLIPFTETLSNGKGLQSVDHSRLVHKYLAPIVAGLVLVLPCLESHVNSQTRAKILSIGVGGGALPTFLQKHFDFDIQAVDVDEVVLRLARMHFDLVEDEHLQVTLGDGVAMVKKIAAMFDPLQKKCSNIWSGSECQSSKQFNQECSADQLVEKAGLRPGTATSSSKPDVNACFCDPRVEVIIVDVDAGDARLGLSSPPSSFLEKEFLVAARQALHPGGMLVINVVPCGELHYKSVLAALHEVFEELYEIKLTNDVNCVVFALPSLAGVIQVDSLFAHQLRRVVDKDLIERIHKVD